MRTKISLIALVLFSAGSLTVLFASPNARPNANAQTEPEEPVSTVVSTSSDNGGMRTRADTVLPSTRYLFRVDLNQPSVTLEPVDVRSLTLEAEQVGINRSVEVSPNTRAQKFVNPDGSQVIVLVIKSTGASGIGVHFRDFALAEGEEVYVYGAAPDSIVFGPFTNKGSWDSGEFWSGTVVGDTAVIEFYRRSDENAGGFEIFEVSHIFAAPDLRLRFNEPDVLNCEVDASCYGDAERNAVGRILFSKNGQWYVCTGTLLNDHDQDFIPYFLTANHCVNSQAIAQTVEVFWFYQTTFCNSGVLRPSVHSPPGATLLATQASTDFCFMRLQHNAPGGAAFSGWDPTAQPLGTGVFGLHHPSVGLPPSTESYLRRATGGITDTNDGCLALVNAYRTGWTSGTTEEGSSGSGLWNSSHHLVGALSCGPDPARCNNPFSVYSKFANFYSQIQSYLGPHLPAPPVANPATLVASNSFIANWSRSSGATGYRLDVAMNNSFTNYVAGYRNLNVGNVLTRGVNGLSASTTYYYRVRAYNGSGTSGNSNVRNVTTLSPTGAPVVTTNPATNITTSSATLNGLLNPHGLTTTVHFQYGTTASYGHTTANQSQAGNTYRNIVANIGGLTTHTTYHFRIVASNSAGTRYGGDRTFTTH